MRLFFGIVVGLVLLAVLWKAVHWALGLAMGLVWIAALVAAVIFVAGLVRRLLRQ